MNWKRPDSIDFRGNNVVTGNTIAPTWTQETHKNIEVLRSGKKQKTFLTTAGIQQELNLDFLPAASESYHISPDPSDYVIVALPIVTVDVPNRNLQAFPLEEVAYFDPSHGRMVYQTFMHKPTHIDHVNEDPTKAKGVHIDASLQYVPQFDLWKIHVLTMWDRSKDAQLVEDILEKRRTGYSMGAFVNEFINSADGSIGLNPTHPKGSVVKNSQTGEPQLSFDLCCGVTFFETSSVEEPADHTALSTDVFK